MSEIIMGLIILALLIKSRYEERENKTERERFIKALMAKNLPEYDASATIKEPSEPVITPNIPLEQADEGTFAKHLKSIIDAKPEDGTDTE